MSARTCTARVAASTLTAAALLTTTATGAAEASAAAAPGTAQGGSYDAGSCGRLDTQIRPGGDLKLKIGKPGRLTIAFATERPCTMNVALRAFGRDESTDPVVGPANYTLVSMPGTFTWTVTAAQKGDGFLAAYLSGSGATFGIRLNDLTVR